MANDLMIDTHLATVLIDAAADLWDSGGTLKIYDDNTTIPADADDGVSTNVLLVTITTPTPSFGAGAAGAVAKAGTWSGTVIASGTANFYRLEVGTYCIQGTVGLTAGTFDLEFANITWSIDGTVTIDTFALTLPES